LRAAGDPGSVLIPGETAARLEAEQRAGGIEVSEALLVQLRELGSRFGLEDRLDD
jgi:LDH2 family malate/lactate/ureidoglycolate dehydrogenase